jgi:hypothetical protein
VDSGQNIARSVDAPIGLMMRPNTHATAASLGQHK